MNIAAHYLNSFCRNGLGGNPAGVVLAGSTLPDATMQNIASQIGFPETAFVELSSGPGFNVRFFTPTAEIDMCGHATIATWSLLHAQGMVKPGKHTQKIKAGTLAIEIEEDGAVWMETPSPLFAEKVPKERLAPILNVQLHDSCVEPQIVFTGLRDILVQLPDPSSLSAVSINQELLSQLNRETNTIGLHVFALEDAHGGYAAHARNFAPLYGIPEEAATGSSNASLACLLQEKRLTPNADTVLRFAQGDSMGQPSDILIRLTRHGEKVVPYVGGKALVFETREFAA